MNEYYPRRQGDARVRQELHWALANSNVDGHHGGIRIPQAQQDVTIMAAFFPPPCPTLPDFQTLLVKGSVHASAPVHFCLSYVLQHDVEKAVLLSPSRAQFSVALKDYRDGWITKHGGDGRTNKAASKVNIL